MSNLEHAENLLISCTGWVNLDAFFLVKLKTKQYMARKSYILYKGYTIYNFYWKHFFYLRLFNKCNEFKKLAFVFFLNEL